MRRYEYTANLSVSVKITCESCNSVYYHGRQLEGRGSSSIPANALWEATSKIRLKTWLRTRKFSVRVAAHEPCPVCGYTQSWQIGLIPTVKSLFRAVVFAALWLMITVCGVNLALDIDNPTLLTAIIWVVPALILVTAFILPTLQSLRRRVRQAPHRAIPPEILIDGMSPGA